MPVGCESIKPYGSKRPLLPETLCEFRSRIDEVLMDELIAIQAAAAMEAGLVSPAHLVVDPSRVSRQPIRIKRSSPTSPNVAAPEPLACGQGHDLHQELVMRSFGRQCRGQGRVFVKLVRQTERQLSASRFRAGPASSAAPGGDRDAPRRSTG